MEDKDIIAKINEIYNDFTNKMGVLINKRKILLKTYRQKLEEAKIKELTDSLSK